MDRQIDRWMDGWMDGQIDRQIRVDRQIDRQIVRQMDGQNINRQMIVNSREQPWNCSKLFVPHCRLVSTLCVFKQYGNTVWFASHFLGSGMIQAENFHPGWFLLERHGDTP